MRSGSCSLFNVFSVCVCVCVCALDVYVYLRALLCVFVLETFGSFPHFSNSLKRERETRARVLQITLSLSARVCVCVFVLDAPIRAHFLIRYAHFSRDQRERDSERRRRKNEDGKQQQHGAE